MERRALVAVLLSAVVLVLWFVLFPPPAGPPRPTPELGATAAPTEPLPPGSPRAEEEAARPPEAVPTHGGGPAEIRGTTDTTERLVGEGFEAEVATRGGRLTALVLTGYEDSEGRPLDLLAGEASALGLVAAGPWNDEPHAVERAGDGMILRWSDGEGNWVEKELRPGRGRYGLELVARGGGRAWAEGLVVGVGIPPATAAVANRGGVVRVDGELERENPAKLDAVKTYQGAVAFAGVEEQYFLLVLLPAEGSLGVRVEAVRVGETPVARVAVVTAGGRIAGTLYGGPKDHEVLSGLGRGLEETLSFGIFGFLSVVFLAVLKWIHSWCGNWGVAIVVLTAAIRVLLFPLTHKSTVAMRRMQAVQPKMKAIQERYKERAKRDPSVRARMNQEVMALYKQEGVNPMGGCLPTLVQLPILFALYTLFANAIELRHAPFMLWITDLSVPDTMFVLPLGSWSLPFRPLALLMGGSMWLQQKVAPQVGDPAQRRMFMMMPFIFTIMFYSFAAGLVLYWLVNNLLTIGQQLLTERLLRNRAASAKA